MVMDEKKEGEEQINADYFSKEGDTVKIRNQKFRVRMVSFEEVILEYIQRA